MNRIDYNNQLIFEKSRTNRKGYSLPELDVDENGVSNLINPELLRKKEFEFPEVSELDLVRHYVHLSRKNFAVDLGFYPLGSCTMKYNPKVNEEIVKNNSFLQLHPLQPIETAQGILALMHHLLELLVEITGMSWGTLAPFAGAHGEYTGMKIFKAFFKKRGEQQRNKILIPDSAHGTNPASAHLAGFDIIELPSDKNGMINPAILKEHLNDNLAGIMLTNPNTLGLFEKYIIEIADLIHKAGGLLYYDGANLNAIVGQYCPGDMGFDVVHLNLHKTFSTPHGGGGPGSGPVLVKEKLRQFLPVPDIRKNSSAFEFDFDKPDSIGRISNFYGNIQVLIRAYAYILILGKQGLKAISEMAVLNANYLKEQLKEKIYLPNDFLCKHEFVLSAAKLKEETGISAYDIAKRLLDYGFHAPTVYFPLNIKEAIMIEPTESESKQTLDSFITCFNRIIDEAYTNRELIKNAPENTPVKRADEVLAAKNPIVRWEKTP